MDYLWHFKLHLKEIDNLLVGKTCYICGQPATSDEHAPARCFFPKNKRVNLTTVHSCSIHNEDTSKDDEYVRNIIAMSIDNNQVALNHFLQKCKKSFEKSPGLLQLTTGTKRKVGHGLKPLICKNFIIFAPSKIIQTYNILWYILKSLLVFTAMVQIFFWMLQNILYLCRVVNSVKFKNKDMTSTLNKPKNTAEMPRGVLIFAQIKQKHKINGFLHS